MWRRTLRSPLFPAHLRNLPSSSRFCVVSSPKTPLSSTSTNYFGSLTGEAEYASSHRLRRCKFLEKLNLSRKSFCCKSAAELTDRCWNCSSANQSMAPFLVCQNCRCIQPVEPSVNYFQIFGLEKTYEIGEANIEGKYKDWQKQLHPDLVHSKSEKEREYAAEQSARVIDARRTLSDPLSRAIYMLKLEGIDVDEEQTISEPELLTEILEIREAVEEAPDSKALNQIRVQMQEKLKHWSEAFAVAFRSRNYEEARSSIQRMTYYKRVNEEITKKL